MKETTKQVLFDKYANSPKGWCKWIKSKANSDLLDELRDEVKYDISLKERMYWLINDMHNFNKCPICGKDIHLFYGPKKGYASHCSCVCTQKDQIVRERHEKTNMTIYGTKNAAQSGIVQSKMKRTCFERYNSENIFSSDIGKEKIRKTNLERYGCENP